MRRILQILPQPTGLYLLKIMRGHLIACRPNGIKVGIQFIQALKMDLPMSLDYLNCDFKRDTAKYWDKSEK